MTTPTLSGRSPTRVAYFDVDLTVRSAILIELPTRVYE